jgi:hypothetical protein
MRRKLVFLLAILALGLANQGFGDEDPLLGKGVTLQFRVLQGDPFGSEQAGTAKLLTRPMIMTREGCTALCQIDSEPHVSVGGFQKPVAIGRRIEVTPWDLRNGKVSVDLTIEDTRLIHKGEAELQVQTRSTRTMGRYPLGQPIKINCGEVAPGEQQWAEVTPEEYKPQHR